MAEEHLTRDQIKTWETEVADLLLHLVNGEGIKYRMPDNAHLLLYPPDGTSRPFKVAASRPGAVQVRYIRRQFMQVYGVKGPDGTIPGAGSPQEEEAAPESIEVPAASEAHAAVRTLAAALGVSLDGTIDEEDYLAVVAEKDARQRRAEELEIAVEGLREGIGMRDETIVRLTEQRDRLLSAVNAAFETLEVARS